jgi:predicted nucleic acid-binding protein
MRVLLDTCVLSELYKPEPLVTVYEAVNNVPDEHLYLSALLHWEKSAKVLRFCQMVNANKHY